MRLKNKKALVIGAGTSGRAAADFLISKRATVTLFDDNKNLQNELSLDTKIICEFNQETLDPDNFDFAVLSPGVSINHPLATKFSGKLTSEICLGLGGRHKKIVAVTGTNGKTTVVNMIHDILNNQCFCKRKAVLCGNSGLPITKIQNEIKRKTTILEVSSFMTETLVAPVNTSAKLLRRLGKALRPNIAMILNISQDHLERHGTMENYIRHKAVLTVNQRKKDSLILNYDDAIVREIANSTKAKVLYFSTQARVKGIYVDDGKIWLNLRGRAKELFDLRELELTTQHEVQNFLATALVCKLLGVKTKLIGEVQSIDDHRIQFVAATEALAFYNDSKATNIAATIAACKSFATPINLLAGGQPKGQDYAELLKQLPGMVQHIFAYGESGNLIKQAGEALGFENISLYETLHEATNAAVAHGMGARVILLSPASASFDQFNGYADRGNKFKEIVSEIIEGANADI